jgi:hypothetical protein
LASYLCDSTLTDIARLIEVLPYLREGVPDGVLAKLL